MLFQNPKSIGYPTMIMSSAEGVVLKESDLSEEQKNAIYEQIGQILKKINEIKINGFGPLSVNETKN